MIDGTSASSPVVAGLVGLLNAHRQRAGRPNVGFFNPLLYQVWAETNGSAFNDIIEGSNRCTEGGCICKTGFNAVQGWDASTGCVFSRMSLQELAIASFVCLSPMGR